MDRLASSGEQTIHDFIPQCICITENILQENCCGVNDVMDYVRMDKIIPPHCCQIEGSLRTYFEFSRHRDCTPEEVTKPGCKLVLEESFRRDQVVLIVHLLVSGMVKAIVLIAAFFIPFREGHIYGSPPFAESPVKPAGAEIDMASPVIVVDPPAVIPVPITVVVETNEDNPIKLT